MQYILRLKQSVILGHVIIKWRWVPGNTKTQYSSCNERSCHFQYTLIQLILYSLTELLIFRIRQLLVGNFTPLLMFRCRSTQLILCSLIQLLVCSFCASHAASQAVAPDQNWRLGLLSSLLSLRNEKYMSQEDTNRVEAMLVSLCTT